MRVRDKGRDFWNGGSMKNQAQNGARFIDVTGLAEESVRALESQVAALKENGNRSPIRSQQ